MENIKGILVKDLVNKYSSGEVFDLDVGDLRFLEQHQDGVVLGLVDGDGHLLGRWLIKVEALEDKTYGVAWCDGGDPEDGGWCFDNGGEVNGYAIAYHCDSRQEALDAGVSQEVLDLYESDDGDYVDPGDLFNWLQQNNSLFRKRQRRRRWR